MPDYGLTSIVIVTYNQVEYTRQCLDNIRLLTDQPYELVVVDYQMRTMIHDGGAEHDLERYARTMTPSIRDDGRAKILRGETTIEEVLRVTRED